ncbi:MAG: hypothetical protein CR984_04595 [Proteobacteria bacterium]|nr:MAG: hypothetical protein CR984_04595 [Pseudomonadota bacterium]
MTLKRTVKALSLVFLLSCVAAVPAFSEEYVYGTLTGDLIDFVDISEEVPDDSPALYGKPSLMGGHNIYFPTNFSSSTEGENGANVLEGTLRMTLQAHDGFAITRVTVTEFGNYEFNGSAGSSATHVTHQASLTVGELTTGYDSTLSHGDIAYTQGNTSGNFTTSASLDFSGLGMTSLDFELVNILSTYSQDGTTATLSKRIVNNTPQVEIYYAPIPIPGAVWLMVSGLMAVAGFSHRKRR